MTESEEEFTTKIANEIDNLLEILGPILRVIPFSHQGKAMGLVYLASHHCWHDNANKEDFINIAKNAWDRVEMTHGDRRGN